jgi:hypothetical protein
MIAGGPAERPVVVLGAAPKDKKLDLQAAVDRVKETCDKINADGRREEMRPERERYCKRPWIKAWDQLIPG